METSDPPELGAPGRAGKALPGNEGVGGSPRIGGVVTGSRVASAQT